MVNRNPSNLERAIFKMLWEQDEIYISDKNWVDAAFRIEELFKKYNVNIPEISTEN